MSIFLLYIWVEYERSCLDILAKNMNFTFLLFFSIVTPVVFFWCREGLVGKEKKFVLLAFSLLEYQITTLDRVLA